ncbi:MAG: c-type cytochrome [Planctomycetes bacterium]|nr:c-type cytochrome [Planctomycetota bacterium]
MNTPIQRPTGSAKPAAGDRRWELLLLISSLTAALLFGAAAFRENNLAPWIAYQRAYRSALFARATDERTRRAAASFEIRYYQVYLPGLGRIDRCPTCHLGAEDPLMKDRPEPLRTHPGNILAHHPSDRFGCTICHGGRGRATEAREAHGAEPGRPAPMRRGDMLQAACAQCHSDAELPGMPVYNLARALFAKKACLGCHSLRGAGGAQGPDLTAAAGKHGVKWHVRHFMDPQKAVPGSKMPNPGLTEEEARALACLMMSFTGENLSRDYLPVPGARKAGGQVELAADRLGADVPPGAAPGYVGSETCLVCHSGLHPEAVESWRNSKMAHAFEAVRDAPDRERCLPCHATGYNPATNQFAEPNVTCEACHGPGKDFVPAALDGKVAEHRDRALANVRDRNPCVRCHQPHVPKEKHEEAVRRAAPKLGTATAAIESTSKN